MPKAQYGEKYMYAMVVWMDQRLVLLISTFAAPIAVDGAFITTPRFVDHVQIMSRPPYPT